MWIIFSLPHDDVIKWKHFPRNWPFVREIHRSPVNFPHKGQWRGALMFSLIYAWINDWVNNREAGDLRRQHGHYDVIVMREVSFFYRLVSRCIDQNINHTKWPWRVVPFNIRIAAGFFEISSANLHDDVNKWKHFPRYWPFVRGIHRPPVNSPYKGQWRGVLMFSLICVWINTWVNNREAGYLRRHRAHYHVMVMEWRYHVNSFSC